MEDLQPRVENSRLYAFSVLQIDKQLSQQIANKFNFYNLNLADLNLTNSQRCLRVARGICIIGGSVPYSTEVNVIVNKMLLSYLIIN